MFVVAKNNINPISFTPRLAPSTILKRFFSALTEACVAKNRFVSGSDFPYRTRRTVKPALMDGSREIARDLLLEILEDAHWAPTHGLTQPWRFHVFTGEARARLANGLQTLYDQLTPEAEFRPEKRSKLRDVESGPSYYCDRRPSGRQGFQTRRTLRHRLRSAESAALSPPTRPWILLGHPTRRLLPGIHYLAGPRFEPCLIGPCLPWIPEGRTYA